MFSPALKDKKILLFSQYFFGYETKIKDKMQEMGASVDLFDEMSVSSMRDRALLKVVPNIFNRKTEKYYCSILRMVEQNSYDYVLFIDCEMPTEHVLQIYKKTFQHAKFCLYLWDSVENLKGVEKKFNFFDCISTFDRKDAIKYEIKLRPLFFCDEYRLKTHRQDYKYDICFIGTIHSDRYKILKQIQKNLPNKAIYIYPFLQSKFIYYIYKIVKKEFRNTEISDFSFHKKTSNEISQIVGESRAVIDIQHPNQSGLTMRTLEMVGMKKKLITTNADIVNYDFYNSNNIQVIDRNNPRVSEKFLTTDYIEMPNDIYENYSINRWIIDVLGVR